MLNRTFPLLLIATLSLSACETFQGLQKDLGKLGTATSNTLSNMQNNEEETNRAPVTSADEACPSIIIEPQLDTMSEFSDMENPSDDNLVSKVSITGIENLCALADDVLEMRLDLALASELGPKARRTASDRPYFAYPYFISVTDGKGQELAQEIFAASVTYEPNQDKIELIETINQRLPLNDDGSMPDYQVHIGFQLTDDQLAHNAGQEK